MTSATICKVSGTLMGTGLGIASAVSLNKAKKALAENDVETAHKLLKTAENLLIASLSVGTGMQVLSLCADAVGRAMGGRDVISEHLNFSAKRS